MDDLRTTHTVSEDIKVEVDFGYETLTIKDTFLAGPYDDPQVVLLTEAEYRKLMKIARLTHGWTEREN